MSRPLLLTALSTGLIAAGPVGPDDWSHLSVGGSSAPAAVVVVEHSRQDMSGYSLSLAGAFVSGTIGSFALRAGRHGDYGGLDLGVGMWLGTSGVNSRASVMGWAGLPGIHAWASTWSAEDSGEAEAALGGAGIGHRSTRLLGEVGVWATDGNGVPVSARLAVRRNEGVWIGARGWVSTGETPEVRAMLTLSLSRAGLAEHFARGTAHPM